jgi:hypothetical protein
MRLSASPNPAREGDVRLTIVDALGRVIVTLADAPMRPGEHSIEWDLSDVAEGLYLIALESDGARSSTPIIISR